MKMVKKSLEPSDVALQVLEAIRATNPELIADNMPDGWGMNRLRETLQILPQMSNQVASNTLEPQVDEAKRVVTILYRALNDASAVVDAGDDEAYAYQAELEAGAGFLGLERDSPTERPRN